jgi:phosphoserine phosphatase RsbU/P
VSLLASTAIALVDVVLSGSAILISVLTVGPLLAAMNLGGSQTAAAGAYSLALAVVLGVPDGIFGTADHVVLCLVIAVGAGFCTLLAARRNQREQDLARMTRVAEVAQEAILRPIPARIGGVLFAARYLSATHEALIGGDFYDVAASPYGLRVVVGDVKGKGVDAVRLASLVLGGFREAAFLHHDLVEVAVELDRSIGRHLGDEDFVTAVMVEFGPAGGLEVVNCGHPPPLLLHNGSARLLLSPSPSAPLGLGPSPACQRLTVSPSDRLLLYTDGLVEARAADGNYFDLDAVASEALAARSLNEALDDLVKRVLNHVGGQLDDDMALVLAQPRRLITRRRAA